MVSEELEARLSKIEAMEDIKNLQARYVYLLDTRQVDEIPDLFADDFVFDAGAVGQVKTKSEMLEVLRSAVEGHSMMCHQVMTPYIELDGDKATGTWYLFGPFTAITPQEEVAYWLHGKYENEYVRVDGKWKFSLLKITVDLRSPYDEGWLRAPMADIWTFEK